MCPARSSITLGHELNRPAVFPFDWIVEGLDLLPTRERTRRS